MRRLLIDECLSPRLAARARQRGWDARHVTHLGRSGWQDYSLLDLIVESDFVFLTQNARDFWKLFATLDHTINRVIEVHSPTDIRLSNLPPVDENN